RTIDLGARVMSSTSLDVDALLESGGLREDLFYRINVVTLRIPPLRERRQDIPRLARQFLRRAAEQAGKRRIRTITPDAMALLVEHAWPGNVRELRNVIERAVILESSERITADSLPIDGFLEPRDFVNGAARRRWTLDKLEARYIREILRRTGENYSQSARILGINRKTLLEKRRRYGL
ncbi:MAG TPA: helix-turn-helix domain-containing protein, partial [Thermoanaerobaculia bacterium]|nr:helix-turn-helix domain-containing protein [Thermoanaerobaculia bacterium]